MYYDKDKNIPLLNNKTEQWHSIKVCMRKILNLKWQENIVFSMVLSNSNKPPNCLKSLQKPKNDCLLPK